MTALAKRHAVELHTLQQKLAAIDLNEALASETLIDLNKIKRNHANVADARAAINAQGTAMESLQWRAFGPKLAVTCRRLRSTK
jgi:hypothetical protein